MKKKDGITLISLIITIIILMILSAVAIKFIYKEDFIDLAIGKAEIYETEQYREEEITKSLERTLEETKNKLEGNKGFEIEALKNYIEIYRVDLEGSTKKEYTLEENYDQIIMVVSSIGDGSGTYAASTNIKTNNDEALFMLMSNERIPYSSAKYYSSTTAAYMISPKIGTTITISSNYRGVAHIYALGK